MRWKILVKEKNTQKGYIPAWVKQKGFTLIELLVVIAIIGLLASVVLVAMNNARAKARTTKRIMDLKQLSKALELYYNDNNAYPDSTGGTGVWDGRYTCWGDSSEDWIAGLDLYVSKLPRDPRNNTTCAEQYIYRSDGTNYKLISHYPENCSGVKTKYPNLIDPSRDCWAFGFWTPGAATW